MHVLTCWLLICKGLTIDVAIRRGRGAQMFVLCAAAAPELTMTRDSQELLN